MGFSVLLLCWRSDGWDENTIYPIFFTMILFIKALFIPLSSLKWWCQPSDSNLTSDKGPFEDNLNVPIISVLIYIYILDHDLKTFQILFSSIRSWSKDFFKFCCLRLDKVKVSGDIINLFFRVRLISPSLYESNFFYVLFGAT